VKRFFRGKDLVEGEELIVGVLVLLDMGKKVGAR
jgi:hypothetical protein